MPSCLFPRAAAALIFVTGTALFGCSSDTSVTPVVGADAVSVDQDAARTIASEVSEDTGGVIDQLGDVLESASTMDFGSLRGASRDADDRPGFGDVVRNAEYDDVTGVWTVTISRTRGNPDGPRYASIERVYEIQYLSPAGEPQQFYTTDDVTASTIHFDIISGSGEHHTPVLDQELTLLEGSFIATNTDTDLVTINGTYARAASSFLTTRRAERTMDHSVTFTITDLTGPRRMRPRWANAVSGTIEGDFHADITWVRGDAYAERTIDRHVVIVIVDGELDITVSTTSSGSTGHGNFHADAGSGELIER